MKPMRRILMAALAVGLLGVASVAAVAAQAPAIGIQNPNSATPTKLFFHISGFDDFPINTQPPSDNFSANPSLGLGTSSTSCLPSAPGAAITGQARHTFYGYSSPGFVEYNFLENGRPRVHPERGLSYDVEIDSATPWMFHWYLKTQALAGNQNPDPNQGPVVVPNVIVKATIRTGDGISIGNEAYNKGDVIAEGRSAPITLAGDATGAVNQDKTGFANYTNDNGNHVYHFAVPLTVNTPKIPKLTGYNVRVDVYMDVPSCNDPSGPGYFMANNVRTYTAPAFRPRMELAVMNPLRIEYMHPEFVGDEMVIHTSENSPWGNYDVNNGPGGVELHIKGPGFEQDPPSLQRAAFVQRFHEHNFHTKAVDVTYAWPYKQDNAQPGTYTVSLAVRNLQETATATGTVTFEIGKGTAGVVKCGAVDQGSGATAKEACVKEDQTVKAGGEVKESPGAAIGMVIATLGAALVLRRRL